MKWLGAAIALAVARILVPSLGITLNGSRFTLSEAHGQCQSAYGQVVTGLNGTAAHDCAVVGSVYAVLTLVTAAVVVCGGLFIWSVFRHVDRARGRA